MADPLPVEFAEAFELVRESLAPFGQRTIFFDATESTNDVALALASAGDSEGTVVVAEQQTAGRGRRGRTWHSPPGGGLYVSVVLRPSRTSASAARATRLVTLAAGVALAEAVEEISGLVPEIKWPNDLLVERRKLAGILAEAVPGDLGQVIVGYGINVSNHAFPADLHARATSLESELGRTVDRAALCAATLAAMARRYRDLLCGRFDAILDAWRARSTSSRGARVMWGMPSGPKSGVTAGIDDEGALLVRVGDDLERIVGGEVTWAPDAASD